MILRYSVSFSPSGGLDMQGVGGSSPLVLTIKVFPKPLFTKGFGCFFVRRCFRDLFRFNLCRSYAFNIDVLFFLTENLPGEMLSVFVDRSLTNFNLTKTRTDSTILLYIMLIDLRILIHKRELFLWICY